MLDRSLIEQVKGRWREFRREPSAFFWVVFMPILWMVALGFAFSEPKPEIYGVGIEEQTAADLDPQLARGLEQASDLIIRNATKEQLPTLLQRGEIVVFLKQDPDTDALNYYLDPANPTAVRAKRRVHDVLQIAAGRQDVLSIGEKAVTAQGTRYIDFLIPGLLGMSIMTSSLFGVGMTIVSNRKENLLKRYIATPMRPSSYIVSHIIGRGFILAAEFFAVMITGLIIFQFEVYGDFFSFLFIAALGAAAFTAIALLCASKTRSIPMISGVTNLITLPSIMLSGVFFSKTNFPDWLRSFTDYLPLTALNDALRKIALEGQGLSSLSFEMLVMAVYLIVAAVIAQLRFRWF